MTRYELLDQLIAHEKASHFPETSRSFFGEGPHLVSSPSLPWGNDVCRLAVEAYVRFIRGMTWVTGVGAFQMEREIISWMGDLLGAPGAAGLITSGGSESNYCGLLTAKARSGGPGSVVFPSYTHYSIYKACTMFGLEPIPVRPTSGSFSRVDPSDVLRALRADTIAVVATAGTWAYGGIDPIEEIGQIAAERGLYFHVDACCGGYVLPFLERSGYNKSIPNWDFRVAGVCSIAADLHKHGMTPPPASTLFFRDETLLAHTKEICPPHGAMAGTRPAGPIAAAWTMVKLLGLEGYIAISRRSMELRDELIAGIQRIPGLKVYPGSMINLFTVYSDEHDLHAVWQELRGKGWMLSTISPPPPTSLVFWVLPQNEGEIGAVLSDLELAMRKAPPIDAEARAPKGSELGLYGDISIEF